MSGSITIKGGGGYDAPWIVAEAPEGVAPDQQVAHQRAYILAAFGMDPQDPDIVNLTLGEVVAQAGFHFQGIVSRSGGNRRNQGRGRSANLGDESTAPTPAQETQEPAQEPAAAPATESKAPEPEAVHEAAVEAATEGLPAEVVEDTKVHPHQDVLDEIAQATTKKELKLIYGGNKEAMQDPTVLDALQARSAEAA